MATIDLIVLGILKKESMSAYDIQKMVEYRNISKWVKITSCIMRQGGDFLWKNTDMCAFQAWTRTRNGS